MPDVPTPFADLVCGRVARLQSRVCVGCDPDVRLLPPPLLLSEGEAAAVDKFGRDLIGAVAPYAAAVKFQSAFYERLGSEGIRILEGHLRLARAAGLPTILDAKRGDVGHTTRAYADAYLTPGAPLEADALTVSPYLGGDTLEAFAAVAAGGGKGMFVLVKTSNPSAGDVQDVRGADGRAAYEVVATLVKEIGERYVGESGYSSVGAVAGATYPQLLSQLRALMPRQIFLLPGVGAQGGEVEELRPAFDPNGLGGLVASSRGVALAWRDRPDLPWDEAVAAAAARLALDVNRALGLC